jgi:hypothetical protein
MLNEIFREMIKGFLPEQVRETLETAANNTVLYGARAYYKYTEIYTNPQTTQDLAADYIALARYNVDTCNNALKTLSDNLRTGSFGATAFCYCFRLPVCALAFSCVIFLPAMVQAEKVRAEIIKEFHPKMSSGDKWLYTLRSNSLPHHKIEGETQSSSMLKSVLPTSMPVIRTKSAALYKRN